MSSDSFGARSTLDVGGRSYEIFRLDSLADRFDVSRLPYSIKVLLENVLRLEDGVSVTAADVEAIAGWDPGAEPSVEIPFQPARVLMQDFTGVPAVVDLAAMRDAMAEIGGDPEKINPLVDVDLVIDHSVQVDAFGNERAFAVNAEREFERNRERYSFLKWGREAFDNFSVVPPATGICHQVNLEHIAQVVYSRERDGGAAGLPGHPGRHRLAHDDGQRARRARLGRRRDRGRGGDAGPADLDAAAAGRRLQARWRAARGRDRHRPGPDRDRDAARARGRLQVRRVLRPRPGDARPGRPGDDRQHVAGVRLDLRDLPRRRRDPALPGADRAPDRAPRAGRRLRARAGDVPRRRARRSRSSPTTLELDLGEVAPSIAGPKRPQDRVPLVDAKEAFLEAMEEFDPEAGEQMGNSVDEALEESFPGLRPVRRGARRRGAASRAGQRGAARRRRSRRGPARTRSTSPSRTAPASSSTTAGS